MIKYARKPTFSSQKHKKKLDLVLFLKNGWLYLNIKTKYKLLFISMEVFFYILYLYIYYSLFI